MEFYIKEYLALIKNFNDAASMFLTARDLFSKRHEIVVALSLQNELDLKHQKMEFARRSLGKFFTSLTPEERLEIRKYLVEHPEIDEEGVKFLKALELFDREN